MRRPGLPTGTPTHTEAFRVSWHPHAMAASGGRRVRLPALRSADGKQVTACLGSGGGRLLSPPLLTKALTVTRRTCGIVCGHFGKNIAILLLPFSFISLQTIFRSVGKVIFLKLTKSCHILAGNPWMASHHTAGSMRACRSSHSQEGHACSSSRLLICRVDARALPPEAVPSPRPPRDWLLLTVQGSA